MYVCIGGSLPFWVFIVIGVSAATVVLILIVCVCIFIARRCRRSRKNEKVYKVNSQNGEQTELAFIQLHNACLYVHAHGHNRHTRMYIYVCEGRIDDRCAYFLFLHRPRQGNCTRSREWQTTACQQTKHST